MNRMMRRAAIALVGTCMGLSGVAQAAVGGALGWGDNALGQLGDGSFDHSHVPVGVRDMSDVTAVAAGFGHGLALKVNGTVWSWGANDTGQLGRGNTSGGAVAMPIPDLTDVIAISTKRNSNLALKSDGTVWAWGDNANGQLGDGTTDTRDVPTPVSGLSGIVQVDASYAHGIALRGDGTVWVWGGNGLGQLGGTQSRSLVPIQVPNLTGVSAVAAGGGHNLALKPDGTVWAWGYNFDGAVGDGTNTLRLAPVKVSTLHDVMAIEAGYAHSLALLADGTVKSWGKNHHDQLGLGTSAPASSNVPVLVPGLSEVVRLGVGLDSSFAILADGAMRAWGFNDSGELGDGTSTQRAVPVPVTGISTALDVDGGGNHTVALARPRLSVTSSSLDFGAVPVGSASADQMATLRNDGPGAVTIDVVSPSGANAGDFPIRPTSRPFPAILNAGETLVAPVYFYPSSGGGRSAQLRFLSNALGFSPPIALSGTGVDTADVRVTMTAKKGLLIRSNITYTITVINAGPSVAQAVRVADTLPANSQFVSAKTSQGVCTFNAGLQCALGSIASADRATITLVIRENQLLGQIRNTATATTSSSDPNPANNTATVTVSAL